MSTDKAYSTLDLIAEKNSINQNEINELAKLSHHIDPEIRAYVAELLVLSNSPDAEKLLINLSNDNDEIVRVNACDSLALFPTIAVYKRLRETIANDSSLLVKRFAILSLADIMNNINVDKNDIKVLFLNLSLNRNTTIAAACYRGLYMLGYKEYLNNLIKLTTSENYQDRCTVVNILGDIISNDNERLILSVLQNLRKFEQSEAVISTIDRTIIERDS